MEQSATTEAADGEALDPRYFSGFYPMHLGLMAVAGNVFPIAWCTPVSKEPFRFVAAVDRKNYSLELIRRHREGVLHYFPFDERERVVRAGYLSGRRRDKAARLGFRFRPATALAATGVLEGALAAFELRVHSELAEPEGDHAVFLFDVAHVHRGARPAQAEPLLFLGWRDFATVGKRARFRP